MNPSITLRAGLFVLAAIALAYVLRPRLIAASAPGAASLPGMGGTVAGRQLDSGQALNRAVMIYAVLATALIFFLANPTLVLLALMALTAALVRSSPLRAVALLVPFLLFVPSGYVWRVDFPGINYLIDLDLKRALSFSVLLPAFFAIQRRKRERRPGMPRAATNVTDVLVFGYVAYTFLLDWREVITLTASLRNSFYQVIELPLLYYVLSRAPLTWSDVRSLGQTWLAVLIPVVGVGFLSAIQRWDHYFQIPVSGYGFSSARGGSLRVSGALSSVDFGMFMGLAAAVVYSFRDRIRGGLPVALAWGAAALIALMGTRTRGGILAAMIIGVMMVWFRIRSPGTRWFLAIGGTLGVIVGYSILSVGGFSSIDQYGTFSYRQDLLAATARHVAKYPLFGSPDYADDPLFEPLRQGQGIIDFVNGYVQIVLPYGLIGLALFVGSILTAWFGLVGAVMSTPKDDEASRACWRVGVLFGAFLPAIAVLVATTSFVSYNYEWLFIGVALCRGYARVQAVEAARAAVAPIASEPRASATPEVLNGSTAGTPPNRPEPTPVAEPVTAEGEPDWSAILGIQKPAYDFDVPGLNDAPVTEPRPPRPPRRD